MLECLHPRLVRLQGHGTFAVRLAFRRTKSPNKPEQAIASQRVLFSLPSVERVDCLGGLARLPVLQRSAITRKLR